MPQLEIHRGKGFYKNYVLPNADVIVIGRTHSSDVVLPDESRRVSRMHAALVRMSASHDHYFIRDLGSAHGTAVNGSGTYQHALNDLDTIEIGDYRLLFSTQTHEVRPRNHLKVGRGGGDGSGWELSTSILQLRARHDTQPFTAEQHELLEQFDHKFQKGATQSEYADLVAAILRTIHADRGFIGIFSQASPDLFVELAVTNLREDDEIEISDTAFAQHLREREAVQVGGTVLMPFGRKKVAGFLCVNRRDQQKPLTANEVEFLRSIARLMPSPVEVGPPVPAASGEEPMEWPMEMVGRSKEWLEVLQQIRLASESRMNVLVLGETGSGKELVARALHKHGLPSGAPYVARNCSQTTETLAETEIFGYAAKSGIAGADPKGSPGWFELAHRGTLFLDEVHCLAPAMQDKFLRVLQDKQVWRIGARSPVDVEVNVVAATDEDLGWAINEGRMREPFVFRFGAKIWLPPLQRRREDIPLLAYFFLDKYSKMHNSRSRTISRRGLHFLWNYQWPGNVRQLENVIHSAVARDHEVIFSWDLQDQSPPESKATQGQAGASTPSSTLHSGMPAAVPAKKPKSMDEVEKEHIKEVLEVTQGNVTRAAEMLGYKSRQTILSKMDRYGIPRDYADPQAPE